MASIQPRTSPSKLEIELEPTQVAVVEVPARKRLAGRSGGLPRVRRPSAAQAHRVAALDARILADDEAPVRTHL